MKAWIPEWTTMQRTGRHPAAQIQAANVIYHSCTKTSAIEAASLSTAQKTEGHGAQPESTIRQASPSLTAKKVRASLHPLLFCLFLQGVAEGGAVCYSTAVLLSCNVKVKQV